MSTNMRWGEFAENVVRRLINPEKGKPFLIIADTATDPGLAQELLVAGIRSGADTQLLTYERKAWGEKAVFGPIVANAVLNSKYIFGLHTNFCNQSFTREALKKGARILSTQPWGVEDFLIEGFLDIDYDAQVRNGWKVVDIWDKAKKCHIVSDSGTDISFSLEGRLTKNGDGLLTEDGEMDYFPGVQVTIAPVEETINGIISVDASDNIQGVVAKPYTMTLEKGVITKVEGGLEASRMDEWLKSRNDPVIYHLCHFTIGLNPKAGISGNMIEDERLLGCVDFGFGSQPGSLGGTVGLSPYHMDVILGSPTIYIDDVVMIDKNKLNYEFGFEEM